MILTSYHLHGVLNRFFPSSHARQSYNWTFRLQIMLVKLNEKEMNCLPTLFMQHFAFLLNLISTTQRDWNSKFFYLWVQFEQFVILQKNWKFTFCKRTEWTCIDMVNDFSRSLSIFNHKWVFINCFFFCILQQKKREKHTKVIWTGTTHFQLKETQ